MSVCVCDAQIYIRLGPVLQLPLISGRGKGGGKELGKSLNIVSKSMHKSITELRRSLGSDLNHYCDYNKRLIFPNKITVQKHSQLSYFSEWLNIT